MSGPRACVLTLRHRWMLVPINAIGVRPEYVEHLWRALLASVLPLAIGAAISPTLLALQLVVLTGKTKPVVAGLGPGGRFGPRPGRLLCPRAHRPQPPAFRPSRWLGAGRGDPVRRRRPVGRTRAVRSFIHRPTSGEQQASRTAGRLSTAPTWWFVGAGAIGMVANFSTLVLFLAALHEIGRSSLPFVDRGAVFRPAVRHHPAAGAHPGGAGRDPRPARPTCPSRPSATLSPAMPGRSGSPWR